MKPLPLTSEELDAVRWEPCARCSSPGLYPRWHTPTGEPWRPGRRQAAVWRKFIDDVLDWSEAKQLEAPSPAAHPLVRQEDLVGRAHVPVPAGERPPRPIDVDDYETCDACKGTARQPRTYASEEARKALAAQMPRVIATIDDRNGQIAALKTRLGVDRPAPAEAPTGVTPPTPWPGVNPNKTNIDPDEPRRAWISAHGKTLVAGPWETHRGMRCRRAVMGGSGRSDRIIALEMKPSMLLVISPEAQYSKGYIELYFLDGLVKRDTEAEADALLRERGWTLEDAEDKARREIETALGAEDEAAREPRAKRAGPWQKHDGAWSRRNVDGVDIALEVVHPTVPTIVGVVVRSEHVDAKESAAVRYTSRAAADADLRAHGWTLEEPAVNPLGTGTWPCTCVDIVEEGERTRATRGLHHDESCVLYNEENYGADGSGGW